MIETAIQSPIVLEPAYTDTGDAIDRGEIPSNKNAAIGLQSDSPNGTARARIETAVHAPVGVEPGTTGEHYPVDLGESAANEQLAIRLQSDGINSADCTRADIKSAVHAAIGVESSEVVASDAV